MIMIVDMSRKKNMAVLGIEDNGTIHMHRVFSFWSGTSMLLPIAIA